MHRLLPVFLLPLLACGVDPAPQDLERLTRWAWVNYERADDDDIADAIEKLHTELQGLDRSEPIKGTMDERLTREDLEPVQLQDKNDPATARGFLTATVIACPLEKVEPLIYALNQDELHPGTYDTYARTHTSDLEAYVARKQRTLTWTTDIKATPLPGTTYTERIDGGVRWVAKTPLGPAFLSRTVLPEPAKFDDASDYFRQDYQIELFYERKPGETVHVFGVWREMKVGIFDTEGSVLASIQVDNFVKWDEQLERLCQGKKP